jgi:superfamily II DNA or RNA helicase
MIYTLGNKNYTLRQWQEDCYNKLYGKVDKILLCCSTGLGKTLMSLILADKHPGTLLVICIKKKKADWIRDTKYRDAIVMTRDDIYTQPIPTDVGCVIIDELHMVVSNSTSERFMVLYRYLSSIPHVPVLTLSATPIRTWQSLFSYYCLFGIICIDAIKSWVKEFQYVGKQWMKTKEGKAFSKHVYKDREDKETKERIRRGLQKISYIYFEDNPNATERTEIVPISLVFPVTEKQPTPHDFYRIENQHPKKIAALLSLIQDWTVVVCYYRDEVEWLRNLLNCKAVSGAHEYTDELRDEKVLVIQADSATGYELPNHKRMIFYSYSYTYVNFVQSKGRIDRGDQPDVEYIYLQAKYEDCNEPTMDKNIIKSLENKKSYDPSTWSIKNYEHNDINR